MYRTIIFLLSAIIALRVLKTPEKNPARLVLKKPILFNHGKLGS